MSQAAWLPVVVRSWTSVRLEYSVAHYTYASRGFDYAAAYSFNDDAMCGQRTYTTHSGKRCVITFLYSGNNTAIRDIKKNDFGITR